MFNANSFVTSKEYREENFTTCPEDRPLIVQFAGHDPEILLRAAKYVEDKCDAIDINLGCPQSIAKRGRYGAFLMEELDLLTSIIKLLSSNLKVPITCKSRIYKDFDRSIKLYETLVDAGASLLTIHGRTREEKGHNTGRVDWEMIRRIREYFGDRIPIFSNGGIECYDDIDKCLNYTKVDGVMVSEAILENPALFINNVYNNRILSQVDLTGKNETVYNNVLSLSYHHKVIP
jgi:tRNA-dihydrouridine synthase 1